VSILDSLSEDTDGPKVDLTVQYHYRAALDIKRLNAVMCGAGFFT
jgi:hypothetical protein